MKLKSIISMSPGVLDELILTFSLFVSLFADCCCIWSCDNPAENSQEKDAAGLFVGSQIEANTFVFIGCTASCFWLDTIEGKAFPVAVRQSTLRVPPNQCRVVHVRLIRT